VESLEGSKKTDANVSVTCVNTASVSVIAVGDSKARGEMTSELPKI